MNRISTWAKFTFLVLGMVIASRSAGAQDVNLEVGDKAPAFEGLSAEGELWRSSDYVGSGLLVVYFYPAAMTGGCTEQACTYRDNRTQLTELGAEVVGISGDEVSSLEVFKRTNNLNFPLVSDHDGSIARAFGVPVRGGGSHSATVDGEEITLSRDVTTARWTFIIDREGSIVYKATDVNPSGDTEAVLGAIQELAAR